MGRIEQYLSFSFVVKSKGFILNEDEKETQIVAHI